MQKSRQANSEFEMKETTKSGKSYLFLHVLERRGRNHREADKKNICLRVREGTQSVIVLLSGSIEQTKSVGLTPNHNGDGVVVEHLNIRKFIVLIKKLSGQKTLPSELTVGTYSLGNLFVVYEMRRQVLPTAPSPTTTHLIVCI
jgi:hypothetical protein